MVQLTYTEEMKQQDKLWETEKEDLNVMEKLYNELVIEAKSKGFKGIVKIYEANGEMVSEVYENEEELRLVEDGKLDLQGENMSGYCKPLIEKIEALLNKEFVFTTRSKSDYEWMLRIMQGKGIKYEAKGDDWNCHFEIAYRWNEELVLPHG